MAPAKCGPCQKVLFHLQASKGRQSLSPRMLHRRSRDCPHRALLLPPRRSSQPPRVFRKPQVRPSPREVPQAVPRYRRILRQSSPSPTRPRRSKTAAQSRRKPPRRLGPRWVEALMCPAQGTRAERPWLERAVRILPRTPSRASPPGISWPIVRGTESLWRQAPALPGRASPGKGPKPATFV